MKNNDVFISYSRDDSFAQASAIYYALISKGFSAFLDTSDVNYGEFPSQLEEAIKNSSFLVFIASNSSIKKLLKPTDARNQKQDCWIRNELKVAIENGKTIIPVWFDQNKTLRDYFKSATKRKPQASFSLEITKQNGETATISLSDYIPKQQSIKITSSDLHEKITNLSKRIGRGVHMNSLVNILINTLEANCMADKISEFLLDIGEFNIGNGSTVHILSNNLRDYDLTIISLIAISANIKNGVRYLYYYPKTRTNEYSNDFNTLKLSIKDLLIRKEDSNHKIEQWIRGFYLKNHFFSQGINDQIDKIKAQVQQKDQKAAKLLGYFQEDLEKWFNRDRTITTDTLNSSLKRLNENLNSLRISDWSDIFATLSLFFDASLWIISPKSYTKSRNKDDLLNFMQRELKIHTRILEWLSAKAESKESCKRILENIISVPFAEEDCPIKPCYNFSMLTNEVGSVTYASWYAASSIGQNDLDNTVFYKNLDGPRERGILKTFFSKILQQENKDKLIESLRFIL